MLPERGRGRQQHSCHTISAASCDSTTANASYAGLGCRLCCSDFPPLPSEPRPPRPDPSWVPPLRLTDCAGRASTSRTPSSGSGQRGSRAARRHAAAPRPALYGPRRRAAVPAWPVAGRAARRDPRAAGRPLRPPAAPRGRRVPPHTAVRSKWEPSLKGPPWVPGCRAHSMMGRSVEREDTSGRFRRVASVGLAMAWRTQALRVCIVRDRVRGY